MRFAAPFSELGGGEYRLIVGLAPARGENYLARLGSDGGGDIAPCVLNDLLRPLTDGVKARGVAVALADHIEHSLCGGVAHFRRRRVICVDHCLFLPSFSLIRIILLFTY